MSKLTRDGTAESVLRDQILRRERGQRIIYFPCSAADHEQDWQPCPVVRAIHTNIVLHTHTCAGGLTAVNVIGMQLRDPKNSGPMENAIHMLLTWDGSGEKNTAAAVWTL